MAAAGVGSAGSWRLNMRHVWIAAIVSTHTPMTISIGRVDEPTTAKNVAPAAKPMLTEMIIGRNRSHRAWRLYQETAKTSAASRIGSVVPAIARPLTIAATIGV